MKNLFPYRKNIGGIDYEFDLKETEANYFYMVKAENIQFEMHIDSEGKWRIRDTVPIWIYDQEERLDKVIMLIDFNLDKNNDFDIGNNEASA
jgi:hypothetical protein